MERIDKIIVDAVFEGINDFNKSNYINFEKLIELNEKVDIEFGVNLSSLNNTEKSVWYYIYNYVYKLNNKVNIEEIIGIG